MHSAGLPEIGETSLARVRACGALVVAMMSRPAGRQRSGPIHGGAAVLIRGLVCTGLSGSRMAAQGRSATIDKRAVARRYPYAGSIERRLSVGQRPFLAFGRD
jgi:hypothetical protein